MSTLIVGQAERLPVGRETSRSSTDQRGIDRGTKTKNFPVVLTVPLPIDLLISGFGIKSTADVNHTCTG